MKSKAIRNLKASLSSLLLVPMFIGCSNKDLLENGTLTSSSPTSAAAPAKENIWSGVPTQGSADTSFGLQSFTIDTTTHILYVNFTLPVLVIPNGIQTLIPNLSGATLSTQSGNGLSQVLTFGIPLDHFVRDLNLQAPITLPNGNSLPAVPGGSSPKFSCQVYNNGKSVMNVYGTLQYLAAFVPTPGFDPKVSLTVPLKNSDKTVINGYFATIPKAGNFDGGLYISVVFPQSLARAIDNLYAGPN